MTKKSPSAFRTISEVAKELDVQQHVLRFWETKFSQIKPLKRGGGRRYYRPEDIALLKHIHDLLYAQGYTIKGVQNLLKGQTKNQIAANLNEQPTAPEAAQQETKMVANGGAVTQSSDNSREREALKLMLNDLKEIRSMLGTNN